MGAMLPWLWLPCVATVGWFVARRDAEFADRTCRQFAMITSGILAVAVLSGVAGTFAGADLVHRWTSPVLIVLLWQAAPFSAGVLLRREFFDRPVLASVKGGALLALFGVTWLASLTGYLGPSNHEAPMEETRNRFVVLHLWVLPALAAMLHGGWFWILRREATRATTNGEATCETQCDEP